MAEQPAPRRRAPATPRASRPGRGRRCRRSCRRAPSPRNFDFSHLPRRHRGRGLRDPAQQREEDGERVLDGGDDVARRRVEHEHAARRGGRHVHVVDADARAPDDGGAAPRPRSSASTFVRAAHEERVGVASSASSFSRGAPGEVHDLVPGLAQASRGRPPRSSRRRRRGSWAAAHPSASTVDRSARARASRQLPRSSSSASASTSLELLARARAAGIEHDAAARGARELGVDLHVADDERLGRRRAGAPP